MKQYKLNTNVVRQYLKALLVRYYKSTTYIRNIVAYLKTLTFHLLFNGSFKSLLAELRHKTMLTET